MDEFGTWTFLNPAWTAISGFEVNNTLGTFFLEYVHEEEREHNRQIFLRLVERRLEYCRYETRFLTKNGKVRWLEVYSQPFLSADGSVAGLSGSLTDITDRKLAENAIQKLAAFPQVNPNPVLEFAADGSLTYSNQAARELVTALGQTELKAILPPNAGAMACESLASGQKRVSEELRIGGRTLTWSFFPVVASQVVHCYGADITDMLNLEAQFRHAQKLESVGQLAAGVAHDFNNVLTVIQGYAECLLARGTGDNSTATALKQILDASKRASALTRQLLTFSRKQVIQPRVLDLNAVLANVSNLLLRLLGEDIALQSNYAQDLLPLQADAGMLEQVVMNLVVNSRDAMPKGGVVRIKTGGVRIDESYAQKRPESRPGDFICLTVSDTGCGMDAKTLERIFEPFFSTKEVGKGTGLGLATVYGIVKQHEGWIEVESQPGAGTTFRVFFPAASGSVEPAPQASPPPAVPVVTGSNKESILVVEDEPVVRELVCEILRQHQYTVFEAGSGGQALQTWDEQNGKIDLLMTDMVMPEGMTGRELAAQLKSRKPDLKVLYTSGYTPEAMGREYGKGDTAFLPKPYLPPQMLQLVRQCLEKAKLKS
jgi:PAS domain S-box-containing protein